MKQKRFYNYMITKISHSDAIELLYSTQKVRRNIKKSIATDILKRFLEWLPEQLLKGEEFILPFGMGKMYILGKRNKVHISDDGKIYGMTINWGKTKELWNKKPEYRGKRFIYHTNEHTDGYYFKLQWEVKREGNIKYYMFNLYPSFRNKLYNYIMKNGYLQYKLKSSKTDN